MFNGQLDGQGNKQGLNITVCLEPLAALLHHIMPHNVVTALSVIQQLGIVLTSHMGIPIGLLNMR